MAGNAHLLVQAQDCIRTVSAATSYCMCQSMLIWWQPYLLCCQDLDTIMPNCLTCGPDCYCSSHNVCCCCCCPQAAGNCTYSYWGFGSQSHVCSTVSADLSFFGWRHGIHLSSVHEVQPCSISVYKIQNHSHVYTHSMRLEPRYCG